MTQLQQLYLSPVGGKKPKMGANQNAKTDFLQERRKFPKMDSNAI